MEQEKLVFSRTSVCLPGDGLTATRSTHRPSLARCPICRSKRLYYVFSRDSYRFVRCADCRLMLLNPQPSDAELDAMYANGYFLGDPTVDGRAQVTSMKQATARLYLRHIQRYAGTHPGRLLEIGCGQGELLLEAQRLGYQVTGLEISRAAAQRAHQLLGGGEVICGTADVLAGIQQQFDICVLSDTIEHVRNPHTLLHTIRQLLRPDGVLFIATPSLDSWSARLLRQNWMEFKPERLFYFDTNTIQNLLYLSGYTHIMIRPGWKVLSLSYIAHHFRRFPVAMLTPLCQSIVGMLPKAMSCWNIPIVASRIIAMARVGDLPTSHKLSVIVPVYNEVATFQQLMELLLRKEIAGLEIEVIIVESNSSDGTREIALEYQDHPRIQLILEDHPRGKGHAVRRGLQQASGDFILIQDADLEYDLEDYEALLEPLIEGREAFVLGARHGGSAWKMRRFARQWLLGIGLNAGHWFFTGLVNLLFAQRLKDPFTMFKVFRRDCLTGLTFSCDRFDFDIELLVKLIRKGYRPKEIPVNYRSRSFGEGKKILVFRDPWTWLWALVRLRLTPINPFQALDQGSEGREGRWG